MHTLYQMQSSGNCYKLRLAMAQLGVAFETVAVDILEGESRTAEFLAMNPAGKVPVLKLPDGRLLPESNAALYYLARGSTLLPDERFDAAQALRWMFFEQYSHEPYIAVARFWKSIARGLTPPARERVEEWMERGHQALAVMEDHLGRNDFFVAGRYTVADIALYAYTHVSDEGGFDLDPYPALRAWLARVAEQPGHISIDVRAPTATV